MYKTCETQAFADAKTAVERANEMNVRYEKEMRGYRFWSNATMALMMGVVLVGGVIMFQQLEDTVKAQDLAMQEASVKW